MKSDIFSPFSKRLSSVPRAAAMIYSNVYAGRTIKFMIEFPSHKNRLCLYMLAENCNI